MKSVRLCRCCRKAVGGYRATYCSDECRRKGRVHHLRLTLEHQRTLRQLRGGLFHYLVAEEEEYFRKQVWK